MTTHPVTSSADIRADKPPKGALTKGTKVYTFSAHPKTHPKAATVVTQAVRGAPLPQMRKVLPEFRHVEGTSRMQRAIAQAAKGHLNVVMPLSHLFAGKSQAPRQFQRDQAILEFAARFSQSRNLHLMHDPEVRSAAQKLLKDVVRLEREIDEPNPKKPVTRRDIDDTLSSFMSLMSRIVHLLENDAYDLYLRIDEVTKNMEFLSDFNTKISATTGTIDLTKDEALRKDFERAIALGVKLDPAKMTYDVEEKRIAKEGVAAKKEGMVNITQQQRMKLQNSTQKTTETYTMWSSLLKAMHNVAMTLAHNLKNT